MLNFYIRKVTLKNNELRYRAVITRSGKQVKSKTFRRKSDARIWSNRIVLEYQKYEAEGITPYNITFSRLCDEYMHAWTGKDHDRVRLILIWEGLLGKTLLSDITPKLVRATLKPKKSKAPATYNKHLTIIRSILEFAVKQQEEDDITEQYISKNPCKDVRYLEVNNKRVSFLSDSEKPRLINACKAIGGKFYLKFLMALTTGMRKGELGKLRWNDIDFDRGLAMLRDTKNGTDRLTPIPDIVMDILKGYREIGNGLLFPSNINPEIPATYQEHWRDCLKTADIQDFRWHDLRHDTASTLARDGKTLKEIAEILGHKSLASTDRYTHLCTEHKSKLLNDTMNKSISL